MSGDLLLGVDVGTSAIKAVAVSPTGVTLAVRSTPTPWRREGPHFDIDPHVLTKAVVDVLVQTAEAAHGTVVGIGVTGIAETGVLLDSQGRTCAPALAWFDPRGDASRVKATVSDVEFRRATGMRLNSKPSIAKIQWLYDNVASARNAVVHLGVGDWIVHSLGGEQATEVSVASRTGLMDVSSTASWEPGVELMGDLLPARRAWAGDDLGKAGGDIPQILRGAVLTNGGHDHQTACLVAGAAHPGVLFDSLGTAEALIRVVHPVSRDSIERLTDADISVGQTMLRDHQVLLAGRLTGLSLERIASLVGAQSREQRQEIGRLAAEMKRDSTFPRLANVGNDHIDVVDITDGVSPAALWHAAVDDLVAYTNAPLELMDEIAGLHESSVVVGGWIHNPMMAAAKSRQLGAYRVLNVDEPGAFGAAFTAGVAAGLLELPHLGKEPQWLSA